MQEIDTSNPAEALRAAIELDSPEQAPQITEPVSPEVDTGTTPVEDSPFTNIDPESLAPELKQIYKQMQADYIQKTQAASERSKQYEGFGEPEQVRNAVEFMQALQDPNNLVQLHTELSDYLQSQGYTKATADAAAADTLQPQPEVPEWESETDPDRDALRNELEQMKTFREEYEQQRLQAEIESALSRQENIIRQANPSYDDKDIYSIYERSYAFGGDLMAAQKSFEGERQRILSAYAETKTAIPAGLSGPTINAPGAAGPSKFDSVEEAHVYAKQRALAIQAMGGMD